VVYLVPEKNTTAIGASILPDGKGDDGLRIAERGARSRCLAIREPLKTWRINRRNSVLRRATGFDPGERHAVLGEIRVRPFQTPAAWIIRQGPDARIH